MAAATTARNWADLPSDLLNTIQNSLPLADFVRFPAVCPSWLSAAARNPRPPPLDVPWLIPFSYPSTSKTNVPALRPSPANDHRNKTYSLPVPSNQSGCRVISSVAEHLITESVDSHDMHLLNLFSNAQTPLPNSTTLPIPAIRRDSFHNRNVFVKVVTDGNIAVALVGPGLNTLGYARLGSDSKWIEPKNVTWNGFVDIVPHEGMFYAVTVDATVAALDFSSTDVKLVDKTLNLGNYIVPDRPYGGLGEFNIVESSSDLHVVRRREVSGSPRVAVFMLDEDEKMWFRTYNLCDCSLFLGMNQSMSLSAVDFPELRSNCIYFGNGYKEIFDEVIGYGYKEIFDGEDDAYVDVDGKWIYDLERGCWERFYGCESCNNESWMWCVWAAWIVPRLGRKESQTSINPDVKDLVSRLSLQEESK